MKTVLISGCSYSKNIEGEKCQTVFENYFNDQVHVENISESGSSVIKSINRCYEWTAIHDFPDLLILPATHLNRYELPIASQEQLYDTPSVSWNFSSKLDKEIYEEKFTTLVGYNDLQKFLEIYNKIIFSNMSFVSNIVRDLIGFASWLRVNKCRHMIFNMANMTNYIQVKNDRGLEKLKWLNSAPSIYKFFGFCGNEWLWYQLDDKDRRSLEDYKIGLTGPGAVHHTSDSYAILMKYMISEILKKGIDR